MGNFSPHIPNALSLSRIPLAVIFLILYDAHSMGRFLLGLCIILLALATDLIDGRLARYLEVANPLGSLIDGLGDKAFHVAIFLTIARDRPSDITLIWALIFREIVTYAIRVIDLDAFSTMRRFRWASLVYAGLVRVYFLLFFASEVLHSFRVSEPIFLFVGSVCGYSAALFGYLILARLTYAVAEAP